MQRHERIDIVDSRPTLIRSRRTDADRNPLHSHALMPGPHDDSQRSTCRAAEPLRRATVRAARPATLGRISDRLGWLLSASAFLVLLSFFLPYTVEKMTFAFMRGKQRAMYETAGEKLQNVALKDLSQAYQLVANRVEPSVVHINVTSAVARRAAGRRHSPGSTRRPARDRASSWIRRDTSSPMPTCCRVPAASACG